MTLPHDGKPAGSALGGLTLRDGALRPPLGSRLAALGECADVRCGTHRLAHPEVRPAFLAFSLAQCALLGSREVTVLALGSGGLLFEWEMLEALRTSQIVAASIHLVDPLYGNPATPGCAAQLEKHRLARGALEAFRTWFSEASVTAYTSLADFDSKAAEDLQLDLVLKLDAEDVDQKGLEQLLTGRLNPAGLFLRLSGCDGHDARGCDDGGSCRRLFARLLSARCEGMAWHRGTEVCFDPPPPDASRRKHRERFAASSPRGRASAAGLQLLRVVAEGVCRGVVAIRDAPDVSGALLGVKHRGDYAVIEREEHRHTDSNETVRVRVFQLFYELSKLGPCEKCFVASLCCVRNHHGCNCQQRTQTFELILASVA
ncbi:unnamed protein product [Symbiodinium natans]|uniref:Uncharacterized protein n=1 Tax=Symbiodinium natans TaxID=878477 RepID=A0A812ID10_9DINO|nr:unnamed protein product [Symbiodinium natans]